MTLGAQSRLRIVDSEVGSAEPLELRQGPGALLASSSCRAALHGDLVSRQLVQVLAVVPAVGEVLAELEEDRSGASPSGCPHRGDKPAGQRSLNTSMTGCS